MTKIRKIILYEQTEALPLQYPIPTGIPGNQTMLVATKIVFWCSSLMQATNGEMWPAQRNIRLFVKADTKYVYNKVVNGIWVSFFIKINLFTYSLNYFILDGNRLHNPHVQLNKYQSNIY